MGIQMPDVVGPAHQIFLGRVLGRSQTRKGQTEKQAGAENCMKTVFHS